MTTSRISSRSEVDHADQIPSATLAYIKARLKQQIYDVMIREYKKSGLSQADLARRLGKEPAVVCRLFSGPGNMTVETIAEILFATSGAVLDVTVSQPPARVTAGGCPAPFPQL